MKIPNSNIKIKKQNGRCVHGNALSWQGHGMLIVGQPQKGKTTLSLELSRQGALWCADDLVFVSEVNHKMFLSAISTDYLLSHPEYGVIPFLKIHPNGFVVEQITLDCLIVLGSQTDFADDSWPTSPRFLFSKVPVFEYPQEESAERLSSKTSELCERIKTDLNNFFNDKQ